jgi:hypothetical protein
MLPAHPHHYCHCYHPEERESNPTTTTTAANQTHMHTEEHGFTQSEIHDDY